MERLSLRVLFLMVSICLLVALGSFPRRAEAACDDPICLLQAREPSLNQFRILDRRQLDAEHEALLVQGTQHVFRSSEERWQVWLEDDVPERQLSGLFVIDRRDQHVVQTLELFSRGPDVNGGYYCPDDVSIGIEEAGPGLVSLLRLCHGAKGAPDQQRSKYLLTSDYHGVRKVLRFGNEGFEQIVEAKDALWFVQEPRWTADGEQAWALRLDPRHPDRLALKKASEIPPVPASPKMSGNFWIHTLAAPNWLFEDVPRPDDEGVFLRDTHRFYPLPQPNLKDFKALRPSWGLRHAGLGEALRHPDRLRNGIGAYQQLGDRIWLATSFYGGEGSSGIGAIGYFDLKSRAYRLSYELPEDGDYETFSARHTLAPWSIQTMYAYGDSLWLSLVHQGEWSYFSGGLARYRLSDGQVERYRFRPVVQAMHETPEGLWLATTEGVYLLTGERLSYFGLSQDEQGKPLLYRREVPLRPYA